MASPAESGPVRTMKRTGRSPWAAAKSASNSPGKTGGESPQEGEIVRVTSDIPLPPMGPGPGLTTGGQAMTGQAVMPPRSNGLAQSKKIMALQQEWEEKQSGTGEKALLPASAGSGSTEPPGDKGGSAPPAARSNSITITPVPFPNAGQPRKPSGSDMGTPVPIPAPKRRYSEVFDAPIKSYGQLQEQKAWMAETDSRNQLRHFTEESVLKQLSEASSSFRPGSSQKSAPGPTTSTAAASPLPSALRQWSTPAQLLARIKAAEPGDDTFNTKSDDTVSEDDVRDTTKGTGKKPDNEVPDQIKLATDGRPYTHYKHANGSTEVYRGMLFPEHYKLHWDQHLPWICPVRDCRRIFKSMYTLTQHFPPRHNGKVFNDNLDGTLSQTGIYAKSFGGNYMLPMVTSQKALSPSAAPPLAPGTPADLAKLKKLGATEKAAAKAASPTLLPKPKASSNSTWVVKKKSEQGRTSTGSPALGELNRPTPVPLPQMQTSRLPSEIMRYLHSFLSPTHRVPDRVDIKALAMLERRRDLPTDWIDYHKGGVLDTSIYACALAFLSGDAVEAEEQCTSDLYITSRLSNPCIALPWHMSRSAKNAFYSDTTCVGCHYWSRLQRRENRCSWGKNGDAGVTGNKEDVMDCDDSSDPDVQIVEAPAKSRSPLAAAASDGETSMEDVPVSLRAAEEQRTMVSPRKLREHRNTGERVASPPPSKKLKTKKSSEETEMESWELAPGRVTNKSGDNIMFSSAYLTNAQPVTVSPDIGMNNVVIKPGNSNHWGPAEDTMRTCTVLEGKVRVKLEGETIQLGPRGGFIVRPGTTCTAENRQYREAVIACTTVKNYEMLSDADS